MEYSVSLGNVDDLLRGFSYNDRISFFIQKYDEKRFMGAEIEDCQKMRSHQCHPVPRFPGQERQSKYEVRLSVLRQIFSPGHPVLLGISDVLIQYGIPRNIRLSITFEEMYSWLGINTATKLKICEMRINDRLWRCVFDHRTMNAMIKQSS